MLEVTELRGGLAFVVGRFVPRATVAIAPLSVQIFFDHALIDRAGLPLAIFLVLANTFVAYPYRKSYAGLLKASSTARLLAAAGQPPGLERGVRANRASKPADSSPPGSPG